MINDLFVDKSNECQVNCRYFNERVRKFISKMVMDKRSSLSVKYYTYKVEFQQVF